MYFPAVPVVELPLLTPNPPLAVTVNVVLSFTGVELPDEEDTVTLLRKSFTRGSAGGAIASRSFSLSSHALYSSLSLSLLSLSAACRFNSVTEGPARYEVDTEVDRFLIEVRAPELPNRSMSEEEDDGTSLSLSRSLSLSLPSVDVLYEEVEYFIGDV